MSTDEYATSYFADETEQPQEANLAPRQEQIQQAQPTQPSYEQLLQGYQTLQSQFEQLKANPLASLGYQPIQQGGNRFNPEDPAVKEAREFLQAQGVLTKDALAEQLAQEAREEFALNHGYENTQHLAADFWGQYYAAKSPQAKAELEGLMNLYESGNRANIAKAIKGFNDYKQRSQNTVSQSQSFGHVPQGQAVQQSSVPRFRSANEFNGWLRTQEPAKQRQIMADWQAGKIPDPF